MPRESLSRGPSTEIVSQGLDVSSSAKSGLRSRREEFADILGSTTAIDYSSDEDVVPEYGNRGKNPTSRRTPESDPDEVMVSNEEDIAPSRTKAKKSKPVTMEGDGDEDMGDAKVDAGKDEREDDKDDKDDGDEDDQDDKDAGDDDDEDEDMASEEYAVSADISCPRANV